MALSPRSALLPFGFALGLVACGQEESAPPIVVPSASTGGQATDTPTKAVGEPRVAASLFVISEKQGRSVPFSELSKKAKPRVVESKDPYYGSMKRFRALAWSEVLPALFGPGGLETSEFLLVASDGYEVRISGKLLSHPSAFLAFGDADHEDFLPIGDQKAHPGPFYMVWEGSEFSDEKKYPRPWSVIKVERLTDADGWKHLAPSDGFGDNAQAKEGHALFLEGCVRCHAMNQEGGHLGPDLNVPQNILAYRPVEQVRAYIKNPRTFRYSNMPDHLTLTDQQLDALIEYLRVMGQHQRDPIATPEKVADSAPADSAPADSAPADSAPAGAATEGGKKEGKTP